MLNTLVKSTNPPQKNAIRNPGGTSVIDLGLASRRPSRTQAAVLLVALFILAQKIIGKKNLNKKESRVILLNNYSSLFGRLELEA
jgi:hypothetical protein